MTAPEAPAAILRRAAAQIRERADAMEQEIADPENTYWRWMPGDDINGKYRAGVDNGLGGASGEMAAPWDLRTGRAVADLLDRIAWMAGLDAELIGRVGCDEVMAIARAYLNEETAG